MDVREFPRPSSRLVTASATIILLCLLAVSGLAAAWLAHGSNEHLFSLVLWQLVLWGIALEQYRGTFHAATHSARRSMILLYLVGILLLFTNPFAMIIGVALLSFGRLNQLWRRELEEYYAATGIAPRTRFSIRELLGLMLVISVMSGVTLWLSRLIER